MMKHLLILVLCLAGGLAHGFGLDTATFNPPDGFVTGPSGSPVGLAIQASGKIVAVDSDLINELFRSVRYTDTGAIDTTWGGTGTVEDPNGVSTSVTVQSSDDKVVVAGWVGGDADSFRAARYNDDGTLDVAGFNAPNGFTEEDVPGQAYSVAIDSLGRVILTGISTGGDIRTARWTSAGILDTTFNPPDGFVDDVAGTGLKVVVQSDDTIVVLADASGTTKTITYDTDGSLLWSMTGPVGFTGRDVKLQSGGAIVTLGETTDVDTNPRFTFTRRDKATGALDGTFGTAGVAVGAVGTPMALAIQSGVNQNLVAVGQPVGSDVFQLLNFAGDGSGSIGFGNVQQVASFNTRQVAIQTDGKIVVSGSTAAVAGDYKVARFASQPDQAEVEQIVTQEGGIADLTPVGVDDKWITVSEAVTGIRATVWSVGVQTPIAEFTPPRDGATHSVDRRLNKFVVSTNAASPADPGAAWIYDMDAPMAAPIELPSDDGANVLSAQYDGIGTRVITVDDAGIARIWDASNGDLITTYTGHPAGSTVTTGRYIDQGEYIGKVVTTSTSTGAYQVRVWDPAPPFGTDIASQTFASPDNVLTGLSDDAIARFAVNCGPSCVPNAALISLFTTMTPDGMLRIYREGTTLTDFAERDTSTTTVTAHATALFSKAPGSTLTDATGFIYVGTSDGQIGWVSGASPLSGTGVEIPLTMVAGGAITWMDAVANGPRGVLTVTSADGFVRIFEIDNIGTVTLLNTLAPQESPVDVSVGMRTKNVFAASDAMTVTGWSNSATTVGEIQLTRKELL